MTIEEYDKLRRLPEWRWWLVTPNQYAKDLCRIHPLKQRQVEEICKAAASNAEVKRVIIFGSSTTYLCNSCSDLDICIEWKDGPYVDAISYDWKPEVVGMAKVISEVTRNLGGYDLMFWDELDGARVEIAVKEKGVVVYE